MGNLELEQDLLSMGYRKLKDHVWAKPIAYQLFVVDLEKDTLSMLFKAADRSGNQVWSELRLDSACLLEGIKEAEAVLVGSWRGSTDTHFEFANLSDVLVEFL
jgi:hypothetical protein